MPTVKRKAFAYITHGDRLLVFSHPLAPDAGIQVPAGTVREDERPEEAVMREAAEETGLTGLVFVCYLGESNVATWRTSAGTSYTIVSSITCAARASRRSDGATTSQTLPTAESCPSSNSSGHASGTAFRS